MEEICAVSEEIERNCVVAITEIEEMLANLPPLSPQCSIYRVPERIREINSKAYTPQVVSIGPFHHGKEHLHVMEEHKLRYLKAFLDRIELGLKDFFEVGKKWEVEARRCYAETIELSSDNFVKMMLVDGCFIVECLLRSQFRKLVDESDHLFNKPWMITSVSEDMLLLENQLPFFVVEGLFSQVSPLIQKEIPPFLVLVNKFFIHCGILTALPLIYLNPRIHHFVDFIRYSYLESFPQVWCQVNTEYCCPPSVTQLHEAGIKFKTKTSCSLIDIKFSNGILEIPQLNIFGTTEKSLRNLIAFEDSHCKDNYIIQYMILLNDMIKTSKDVDLLFRHRIITGPTGREETLRMFEKITSQVYRGRISNVIFTSLSEDLNVYCRTPWHRWMAKRGYYKTIFFNLALVILLLTIIQTVCSLLSL